MPKYNKVQQKKVTHLREEQKKKLDVKKDLDSIMNEIHCMNMRSMLGEKRRDYIRERVKSLGGKEPKRKHVNYKDFIRKLDARKKRRRRRRIESQIFKSEDYHQGEREGLMGRMVSLSEESLDRRFSKMVLFAVRESKGSIKLLLRSVRFVSRVCSSIATTARR